MLSCNHSGTADCFFCYIPSTSDAVNLMVELTELLRGNCVQKIESLSWTRETGLNAFVLLSDEAFSYLLTDGCNHTREKGFSNS